MRYLACSDLHLGAGADLGLEPGERLREQAAVWQQIVHLAGERGCDAILFAGDAFHRNKPTPDELLAFVDPLTDCEIPVFAINGNSHDFVGVGHAMAVDVVSELSHTFELFTTPTVVTLPGNAMLAVLPWTPVSRLVAAQDGQVDRDKVNDLAAELLIETARGLASRCAAAPSLPRILMTHFAISGDADGISTFAREPVLPLAELEQLGFDVIVAGHFHRPQELDSGLPTAGYGQIFYCGSPLPLNFGEGGYEHGCWILEEQATKIAAEFVPLPSRPFVTIDLGFLDDRGRVYKELLGTDVAGAFVKLRFAAGEEQARRIDHDKIRATLADAGACRVWIEPTVERARRERGDVLADGQSRADQLAAYLDAIQVNGDVKPAMLERAAGYLS